MKTGKIAAAMLGLLALTLAGLLVTSLVLGGVLGGIVAAAAGDSELAGWLSDPPTT